LELYPSTEKEKNYWITMKSIPVLTEKNIVEIERSLKKLSLAKYRRTGLPFVTLKYAQTLDGKIATITGDSRWISGLSSLRFAHQMRSLHDATLVGVDTIIRDDPRLTVRLVKGKNPQKIIVDTRLRTPLDCNLLKEKVASSTIIATTSLSGRRKIRRIQSTGAQVWLIRKDRSGHVDLRSLLHQLGQRSIGSILVEGGSKMIASFLHKRLVGHLVIVIATKITGRGIHSVNPSTPYRLKNLISFSSIRFFRSGDDVILEAFINNSHP
jgi:diaminohydroxyphosphoribosylaminopyrimidine deaminase/5-amino-6-(5-phosphoribosylamino)uracil reductase